MDFTLFVDRAAAAGELHPPRITPRQGCVAAQQWEAGNRQASHVYVAGRVSATQQRLPDVTTSDITGSPRNEHRHDAALWKKVVPPLVAFSRVPSLAV